MKVDRTRRPRVVRLSDGTILSVADLPTANLCRWTARRKAVVVEAIANGLIEPSAAEAHYSLTTNELRKWITTYREKGIEGLKVGAGRQGRHDHADSSNGPTRG